MAQTKSIPVPATEFKAKCLQLLDTVSRKRTRIVISKRGKPVAQLVPIEMQDSRSGYGFMKGTIREIGDVVAPIDVEWNANKDDFGESD